MKWIIVCWILCNVIRHRYHFHSFISFIRCIHFILSHSISFDSFKQASKTCLLLFVLLFNLKIGCCYCCCSFDGNDDSDERQRTNRTCKKVKISVKSYMKSRKENLINHLYFLILNRLLPTTITIIIICYQFIEYIITIIILIIIIFL